MVVIFILLLILYYIFKKKLSIENFSHALGRVTDEHYYPRLIYQFVKPEEINEIINLSNEVGFTNSAISGNKVDKNIRTSETCWINYKKYPTLTDLYDRVLKLYELKFDNDFEFEELQVAKYKAKGFYKPHFDQCYDDDHCYDDVKQQGSVRKWTIIIYLNDEYEGGETNFPILNISVKGKSGDILIFRSLTSDDDKVHPLSLHQGTDVKLGEKMIANIWVRKKIKK